AELGGLVQRELRDLPGQRLALTQPIEMRINEMVSGVRADVAVKIYGGDLDVLAETGRQVAALLGNVQGAGDASTAQITGQTVLQVRATQDGLARHGLAVATVMELVTSIGSRPLGEVVEGQIRFPLVARLAERFRRDAAALGATFISTASGQRLPMSAL